MNKVPDIAPQDAPTGGTTPLAEGRGWYLYGIADYKTGKANEDWITQLAGIEGLPVTVLYVGELAAVVSSVAVEDYIPEKLGEHAADVAWLEGMVRGHNDVIDAVHMQGTILPAKFGSVYAEIDDLRRALQPLQDDLLAQLQRLGGTDEWGVHVYADRTIVEKEVADHDPNIVALRAQLTDARPGRAYFLQRKLTDEIATATNAALNRAAQDIHGRLIAHAIDYAVNPAARAPQGDPGKVEILRAAYLVRREDTDRFLQATDAVADDHPGMGVEPTGPWPPYSFVSNVADEA